MKEKRNKPRYNQEFKTFNSEQSCIDVFSKVETLFLQKFFRHNLSDFFQDCLSNVEEDLFLKKIKQKQIKQLASETFLTKRPINLNDFQQRVNQFYVSKNSSLEPSEIPHCFQLLFSNTENRMLEKDELAIVQVRMRADIQKIQSLPTVFYRELEMCQGEHSALEEKDEVTVLKHLKKYAKGNINLFVVYFGDVNFHLFDHSNYRPTSVKFFDREVHVRIHVFFISRMALLQCFKSINKIEKIDYINDLLIQLYDFKREKARHKKLKNGKIRLPPLQMESQVKMFKYLKWLGMVSVTVVSLGALVKFFF